MNNNAQNGSFCNVTTKYCSRTQVKMHSTMLAIAEGGGVWGGGCSPSPENFSIFCIKITRF